jgi:very-short-patch-repair endonuclease
LVIEVYGGPHYKPALDRNGTRQEDDARRIAEIREAGWAVLIVRDTELTRQRWAALVERVRVFLDTGRDPGPSGGKSRR